tara:strand:+ start:4021 stop:4527 length:507 start_codon:yes stop_codon:yes gene_type:complete
MFKPSGVTREQARALGEEKTAFEIRDNFALYFDGSIKKNPGGPGTAAWVFRKGSQPIVQGSAKLAANPELTVNVTEYEGLIGGLDAVRRAVVSAELSVPELYVVGDSQLVIYQCTGRYGCNAELLFERRRCVEDLVYTLHKDHGTAVYFVWVPRTKNEEADRLTKEAY